MDRPAGLGRRQQQQQQLLEERLLHICNDDKNQATQLQRLYHELVNDLGQEHLFESFCDDAGGDDSESSSLSSASFAAFQQLLLQLQQLNDGYPDGGLAGYIRNARKLLEDSRQGVNPLANWIPSVPSGQILQLGSTEFDHMEQLGRPQLGSVGFVLVAGGLGERLGYSDIKIGLPTELSTETSYIQYYIEYILAVQHKYAPEDTKLPLCIMTSQDTNAKTKQLLKDNNYFGMDPSDVTIVQQGQGVPALLDNDARIATEPVEEGSHYPKVVTKPHGHGDIHELLHRHHVAQSWFQQRHLKWLVLFQDTNGLAFHSLPAMLGVSTSHNLVMNSLAVPRKAKQAIGGIATLTHATTGQQRTINVEYNQLDPLLRATPGFEDGDVNDPTTGYSMFPGNINQLLFSLPEYVQILERTQGIMPEFVNPKYSDPVTKTVFKKPTRLECMMQDFPVVLNDDESKRVGFTSIDARLCFSPVKNAASDGAALQASGTQPGTAASGEADQYQAVRLMLSSLGCHVETAPEETYLGITVTPGPAIVFKPSVACCLGELREMFPHPDQVSISGRSTLIVKGPGDVVIERLHLDGAMVIECGVGQSIIVDRPDPVVNKGWVRVRADDNNNEPVSEIIKMRGYRLERLETEHVVA